MNEGVTVSASTSSCVVVVGPESHTPLAYARGAFGRQRIERIIITNFAAKGNPFREELIETCNRSLGNGEHTRTRALTFPLLVVERDEQLFTRPTTHVLVQQRGARSAARKEAEREDRGDSRSELKLRAPRRATQLERQRPPEDPLHH